MDWAYLLLAALVGAEVGAALANRRARRERKELIDALRQFAELHKQTLDKTHENYQASLNRYDERTRANLELALRGSEEEPQGAAVDLSAKGDA